MPKQDAEENDEQVINPTSVASTASHTTFLPNFNHHLNYFNKYWLQFVDNEVSLETIQSEMLHIKQLKLKIA